MKGSTTLKVYLDHFIRRQSLRYVPSVDFEPTRSNEHHSSLQDRGVRYEDIMREDGWFALVRKPDFQRETNAWTPDDCVEFLDSVINRRIIPSIILWLSSDSGEVFVLDGAHRLSVIRAWMMDDWGDRAGDYYQRRNNTQIEEAARVTRELVNLQIGSFANFREAANEQSELMDEGEAPKLVMSEKRYEQARFYNDVVRGLGILYVQWEQGDYESAEQSFLRINRRGQTLDPWEATLIEYRNGSYARSIMSIANGGESGHYWPMPVKGESVDSHLSDIVAGFADSVADIHTQLFVPPFQTPITSLNVPLMVAPPYFQKHKHLLEIIPLIAYHKIAGTESDQLAILKRDVNAPAEVVIQNAHELLSSVKENLNHLLSPTNNSKSLSIVPLFYWYNERGQYARGLLYGFIYWLLAGSDEDILQRKVVFSTQRGRFEDILFNLKPEIAGLQIRGGAGLKGVRKSAQFFQELFEMLTSQPSLNSENGELYQEVIDILEKYTSVTKRRSYKKTSRSFTPTDKSQINIRNLFNSAVRCHICGGVVNLQYGGLQYDHVDDYVYSQVTDPETGEPTHPFCNRHKIRIGENRQMEAAAPNLPPFSSDTAEGSISPTQLQLKFWGEEDFPE